MLIFKKNTKQKNGGFSMDNFTINNYEMKRDIINFSKKICAGASKPESKFTMDMIYRL